MATPLPGTPHVNPGLTTMLVQVPAGVNVWQCTAVWGFGHRCAASHGHASFPCKCSCGEEQPPLTQCPNVPGIWAGGSFVIPATAH